MGEGEEGIMPKKSRKYATKRKTTTRQGKNEYMRQYMQDVRKQQRQAMKDLKIKFPKVFNDIFGKPRKSKPRKGKR